MTLASKILLSALPILVNLYATRYRLDDQIASFPDNPSDLNLPVQESFDFIVVGAGAAGCVLGRRLSDAGFTVLLLEAGGNPPPSQEVPLFAGITDYYRDINYFHQTVPQKTVALANNGIIHFTVGKMMGGSASHNALVYERSNPIDYKMWAQLTGDDSWLYPNILKYFLRAEKYMGYFPPTNQHSLTGKIQVEHPKFGPGRDVWLRAGQQMGFKVVDPNGPQSVGFCPIEFNTERGRRASPFTAYIKPVEKTQKKLKIRRYSVASRILFEGKRAVGVLYDRHNISRMARANKEIILSTGAYRTPIILIQSGIGPADQLKAANASPISILPVGENLFSHVLIKLPPFPVKDKSIVWNIHQNLTFEDFIDFNKNGEGPLTSAFAIAHASVASKRAINEEKQPGWPDLQLYYGYQTNVENTVRCFVSLQRLRSHGRIMYNASATSIEDDYQPIIDFNFFEDESDYDVAIEGIHLCHNVLENTNAFKAVGARIGEVYEPCKHEKFRSPEYWKCFIRYEGRDTNHPCGTTRMGKVGDPRSVVGPKLKVIGVEALRVVDASIIPFMPNSNIAATVVMVAEKASDDIIREHKRRG